MTDAGLAIAKLYGPDADAADAASPPARLHARVEPAAGAAMQAYRDLCARAVFGPAQDPLWVSNWIAACSPDGLIAFLHDERRAVLALPLEVASAGPFRIARLMGRRHANGSFPAADPAWLQKATPGALAVLVEAIGKAHPDIDVVALNRLLPDLDGRANPFLTFPGFSSPNIALAVDLTGGFEALLQRPNGTRKAKRHRHQARRLEAFGPCRRIEAKTPDEVERALEAFFATKEARFRKMGIANVFAPPDIRAFFLGLFTEALREPHPPFVLHALEVGGTLRAVTGSSRCGTRLICEFGSIRDDELSSLSPGGFLFFDNIREACERGFGVYDFSIGDEPYKRSWCDLEIQHREVLLPLTLKGRAFAFGLHQAAWATARVKGNPTLWNLMKKLRRRAAGQEAGDPAS